jgi:hypothetical protein
MKKQDIITEIKSAYERYKTIKHEEFSFRRFISNYDANTKCGTVCCLWGWEPKFGVLEGVNWINREDITEYPVSYFNWGNDIIESLYYPYSRNSFLHKNSTIEEVLSHWQKTINILETSTDLDHLLNLD